MLSSTSILAALATLIVALLAASIYASAYAYSRKHSEAFVCFCIALSLLALTSVAVTCLLKIATFFLP